MRETGLILREVGRSLAFFRINFDVKAAITFIETLRPLRHCAGLSYYDITSAKSHVIIRYICTMSQRSQPLS